jgi:hypothetical protein
MLVFAEEPAATVEMPAIEVPLGATAGSRHTSDSVG